MSERWTDKWVEIHRKESEKQIAKLAIDKAIRRDEWWEEFNKRQEDNNE